MKNILILAIPVLLLISCKKEKPKYYLSVKIDGGEKVINSDGNPSGCTAYINYPNVPNLNYHPEQYKLVVTFDNAYSFYINYLGDGYMTYFTQPNNKIKGTGNLSVIFNTDNTYTGTFNINWENNRSFTSGEFNKIKFQD